MNHLRTTTALSLLTITALSLTACSGNTNNQDSSSSNSSSTTEASSTPSNFPKSEELYGEYIGSTATAKLDTPIPADIAEGIQIHQYKGDPHAITVDVDNTNGSSKVGYYEVDVVSKDGTTTKYDAAFSWYGDMEQSDKGIPNMDLPADKSYRSSEIYNAYLDDSAQPRAKVTETFIGEDPLPDEIAAVYLLPKGMGPEVTMIPSKDKDKYPSQEDGSSTGTA